MEGASYSSSSPIRSTEDSINVETLFEVSAGFFFSTKAGKLYTCGVQQCGGGQAQDSKAAHPLMQYPALASYLQVGRPTTLVVSEWLHLVHSNGQSVVPTPRYVRTRQSITLRTIASYRLYLDTNTSFEIIHEWEVSERVCILMTHCGNLVVPGNTASLCHSSHVMAIMALRPTNLTGPCSNPEKIAVSQLIPAVNNDGRFIY